MTKLAARLVLAFALVGLGASVAAAYVHYQLLSDPLYTSFCDVNATFSCTQVYQSRFSTVGGIPVAIFGGIWFVCAGLLAIAGMVARPQVRESIPGYLFALSTLALAAVLYLLYASVVILKAYCPMCLLTDAAVIAHLHHLRCVRLGSHDDVAAAHCQGPARARRQSDGGCRGGAVRGGLAFRRWRFFRAERRPRQPTPARRRRWRRRNSAASSSSSWRPPRGFRWSSRAMARRCWSSSSTTFSARPARIRTRPTNRSSPSTKSRRLAR